MILTVLILWAMGLNLTVCERGEKVAHQFEQFSMVFCCCEWDNLPIELQRMYLILLSDTQQPKNIQTYAGILCTRETFKQVSKE